MPDAPAFDGRFLMIAVANLEVDRSYQREDKKAHVAKIVKTFVWRNFGALSVVEQKSAYRVVDGAQRLAACKLLGIPMVPCMVYPVAHREEEIDTFIAINTLRKKVNHDELFKARLDKGDETAVFLRDLLKEAGYVPAAVGSTRIGEFRIIGSVYNAAVEDLDLCVDVLQTFLDLYPSNRLMHNPATVFRALWTAAKYYRKKHKLVFLTQDVRKKLKNTPIRQLVKACKDGSTFTGCRGGYGWAFGLVALVNKSKRTGRFPMMEVSQDKDE